MTPEARTIAPKLNGKLFEKIQLKWGPHDADAFTNQDDTAFRQSWKEIRLWINTDPVLYDDIIQKIQKQKAKATLITPNIPSATWF
jgi:hypothetical protein